MRGKRHKRRGAYCLGICEGENKAGIQEGEGGMGGGGRVKNKKKQGWLTQGLNEMQLDKKKKGKKGREIKRRA